MINTFNFSFTTDGERNRTLNIKDAKADLGTNDFTSYAEKILVSGLLNNSSGHITGIKKAELVTQTKVQYL
jgi:hypothetical protein